MRTEVPPRRSAVVAGASLLLGAAVVLSTSLELAARTRVERFVAAADSWRAPAVGGRLDSAGTGCRSGGGSGRRGGDSGCRVPTAAPEGWLGSAQELAVRSLRSRPGWPFHAHVLAEVAYRESREGKAAALEARRSAPLVRDMGSRGSRCARIRADSLLPGPGLP